MLLAVIESVLPPPPPDVASGVAAEVAADVAAEVAAEVAALVAAGVAADVGEAAGFVPPEAGVIWKVVTGVGSFVLEPLLQAAALSATTADKRAAVAINLFPRIILSLRAPRCGNAPQ
jgi:hypothetical protein